MTWHRRHAHLISAGSAALCSRGLDWLGTDGWRDIGKRLLGVLFAGWMLGGMLVAAPLLLWFVTAAWLIAAWRAGRAAERQADAEVAFVQLLADAIGDRNGVLLADVLLLLHRAEMFPEWTVTDVRAQCEALDIPVRDKLKVAGTVSVGVHAGDLTAVWDVDPAPAPPTPSRVMHPGVTSDVYPTTPDPEGAARGDVDHDDAPVREVTT